MSDMAEIDTLPRLLRLPLEIRYLIYTHLLVDLTPEVYESRNLSSVPQYARLKKRERNYRPSITHYHKYEVDDEDITYTASHILSFRSVDPTDFSKAEFQNKRRTTYKIREGRFRAQCMPTTYQCINLPNINATFLAVNRQIYQEAAPILYASYTFDFDTHIEGFIPFMADLTPYTRSHVRRIKIVKRAIPYDKDFDRCEWTNMCNYIADNLSVVNLSLGVVSGKPFSGWENITPFPESEIEQLVQMRKRDEMKWVRDLMLIKGLKKLDISPYIEHCPPDGSELMMFFVAFSASVDRGFRSYLTNQMLHVAQAAQV